MGAADAVTAARRCFTKTLIRSHRAVFELSGGRLGGTGGGMPVLALETTGRKSGKARTTMLTVPIRTGDHLVIVASNGGQDRHPDWYLNLCEHPAVQVTEGGSTRRMTARTATADERAELWPQVTRTYSGYADYQRKTNREIPLVILTNH